MGRKQATRLRIKPLEILRKKKCTKSINKVNYPSEDEEDFDKVNYPSEDEEDFDNYDPTAYPTTDEEIQPWLEDDSGESFSSISDEDISQGLEDTVNIEALIEEEGNIVLLNLPVEIFLDILSRVPIRSLAQCRCVCKTWLKIIHHPRFTRLHHNKAIQLCHSSMIVLLAKRKARKNIFLLDYDKPSDDVKRINPQFYTPLSNIRFDVGASCNGLLFLLQYDTLKIYVCNPVIGEYTKIPISSTHIKHDTYIFGFGYDQVSGEYKVIRILFDFLFDFVDFASRISKVEAEIYTIGSDTWRELGVIPYHICYNHFPPFVNGALHWILSYDQDLISSDQDTISVDRDIVSFDFSKEEFHVVPSPTEFSFDGRSRHNLGCLRSCLCLFYNSNSSDELFGIWVMKDYGVRDSWTKEYVISKQDLGLRSFDIYPLKILEDGEILLSDFRQSLFCYDPNRGSVRELDIHRRLYKFDAISHVESFISLRDIIGPTNSSRFTKRRWYGTLRPVTSHN